MKTLLRNFLSTLRRFRTATLLNILGLSIAFASFLIIGMQLEYDLNFDNCHPDAEHIYRMEINRDNESWAVVPRPFANSFTSSSPHIKAGTILQAGFERNDLLVETGNSSQSYFTEKFWQVDAAFTDVFTFDMYAGTEKALKEPSQVLVPRSIAKKIFGNENAIGKKILILPDKKAWIIGGVYNDFPGNSQIGNYIYYPIPENENIQDWGSSNYLFYMRVDDNVSTSSLIDNFKRFFETNIQTESITWDETIAIQLTPLKEVHFTRYISYDPVPTTSYQTLVVLLMIAIVIIVIAAINFTNFNTALSPVRVKSINTQKILGAGHTSLRLALLMETVITSFISYLLSLLLVYVISKSTLTTLVNADISLIQHPLLLAVTAGISILTGLLAGLYPSNYTLSFPPALALKGNYGLTPGGKTLRNILIGFQFIASFILVIVSLVMFLQNQYMQSSLEYDKDKLIIADMTTVLRQKWANVEDQLKSYAGIEEVTTSHVLLSSGDKYMSWGREYREEPIEFQCLMVDHSFLRVLGIDILEGRDFHRTDGQNESGYYIFNEEARNKYNMEVGTKIDQYEIIGFVPNIKFASFRTAIEPMAFLVREKDKDMHQYLYIKTKKDTDLFETIASVKEILKSIDPDYIREPYLFNDIFERAYQKEQNLTKLISIFSLLAVVLSIVGVFGLVIFESEYRRKEIGIRKVLGSSTIEILLMFNKIYLTILVICFLLAVPVASYGIHKWLENFAYKTPVYWWIYAIAFLLVTLVTMLTVTYQNWQTANQNPIESLKDE